MCYAVFCSECVRCVCMQYDEVNAMIMRRFTQPGDVERTQELVAKVS